MKFEYIVKRGAKKFFKSKVFRSVHDYYMFILEKNLHHSLRSTGFVFYSV